MKNKGRLIYNIFKIVVCCQEEGAGMRLIDADKIDFDEVFVGASDFAQDTRNAAQMLIDAQPTAYDIDKVVEDVRCRCYEMGLDESQTELIVNEIVKQGGASDDVCDTKQDKWVFDKFTAQYGNPYRCSCCGEEFGDTYNYCPNCGVSMKEVK